MDEDSFEIIDSQVKEYIPNSKNDQREIIVKKLLANLQGELSSDDLYQLNLTIQRINRKKWSNQSRVLKKLSEAYEVCSRIQVIYYLYKLLRYRNLKNIPVNIMNLIASLL